jgi:Fe(3+) dicitrate transport protein
MKELLLAIVFFCLSLLSHGQHPIGLFNDTLETLDTIQISAKRKLPEHGWMMGIQEGVIMHGKKTDLVRPSESMADLSSNAARQIFSRTPGIFTLESDASGIQTNIASRGLSPNRSWEFNMRQNGVDMTPDAFGYPESYYTPPIEAVDRIEIMRGAAGLQFGPQFGGMVNYVMKNGKQFKRTIGYEGRQTGGRFQLWDSYNALGGQKGNWNYFGFFHHRSGDSFRSNGQFLTQTGYFAVEYAPDDRLQIGGSMTTTNMLSQQPGGLSDEDMKRDPSASIRSRNWFSTPWHLGEIHLNWKWNETTSMHAKAFGILAERQSVGYLKSLLIADTINTSINTYNPRQVDVDEYMTIGMETRISKSFRIAGRSQTLSIGLRTSRSHTLRNQKGIGTTASDADFSVTLDGYEKSLNFSTVNYALFAEQLFQCGNHLKFTPGIRLERIENMRSGHITWDMNPLPVATRERFIFLAGVGSEYDLKQGQFYANISQAFRPVTFAELTPASTTETVDSTLKDSHGFNADLGFRGKLFGCLTVDVDFFYMQYNDRIGSVTIPTGTWKTNIGASTNYGIEFLVQYEWAQSSSEANHFWKMTSFLSGSWQNPTYTRWDNPALIGNPATEIKGKQLEYAPQYQGHLGLEFRFNQWRFQCTGHAVAAVYTDAANTDLPSANAQVGMLPKYEILDASISVDCTRYIALSAGINNAFNTTYATRRTGGYPGPGLLPSPGRTLWATISIKI